MINFSSEIQKFLYLELAIPLVKVIVLYNYMSVISLNMVIEEQSSVSMKHEHLPLTYASVSQDFWDRDML